MRGGALPATMDGGSDEGRDGVRFSLLGELEVESESRVIPLRGQRLRSLFACLLIHRNRTVSRDRLVDAVWGSQPVPGSAHRLEALVSRLRNSLGEEAGSRIETTPGGYQLRVEAGELDVDRFERLLASGRRALAKGDNERALACLRDALEQWRGPAFGELVYEPLAGAEAARLEETRLDALEALFEAQLRCGRPQEVMPQIEAVVAANPLREHARAQLMRALYGCGRQADALEVYRAGYRSLAQQGVEPAAELRHVQASILRQEPQLMSGAAKGDDLPVTHYVRNDGVAIAYQVSGEGRYDIVYAPPFVTNVELTWQVPRWADLLRRLGSIGRLIRFDKRGTGMSDRVGVGDLDTGVEDLRVVMDAAPSVKAAIIGASEAGPLAILFAAAHPERVWALVLWATTARVAWAQDYPLGIAHSELERDVAEEERIWTEPGYAEELARSIGAPDATELAALWRQSAAPGVVDALAQQQFAVDVRDKLPLIRVPTLVLNREGDDRAASECTYLSEHIAGARHVVFPGADHVMFTAGDFEPLLDEIKGFLDEAWERESGADGQAVPAQRPAASSGHGTLSIPRRAASSEVSPSASATSP